MKALTTYLLCLAWVLAPLTSLRAHPLAGFLAGAGPSSGSPGGGSTYTLVDSVTASTSGSYGVGRSGLNADAYAVEFTPATSYTIARVDLPLSQEGSPTQDFTCEIFTKSAGLPGTLVGSASAAVNGAAIPVIEADVQFFPTASVTSGTAYFIVLRASTTTASDYVNWHRTLLTGNIDVYNAAGPAWTGASTTRTLKYKTYSTP